MKTKQTFFRLAALCLACVFTLSSCRTVVTGNYTDEEGDSFLIDKTGIEYVACSRAVTPVTKGEVYARVGGDSYCAIKFEEPTRFLCDNDDTLSHVYRASSEAEVTVRNFNPVAAYLFVEGETSLFVDQFVAEKQYLSESLQDNDSVRDDSEYTYAIRDTILNTEPVAGHPDASGIILNNDYTVLIGLLSPDYPGLFYEVQFFRDIDGKNYLFDRGTNLMYTCPANIVARLWEDA